ncbi:1307_t:CDS:1, partial [Racocetra fulgida]
LSGPAILGFNQETIVSQLLNNVIFIPLFFKFKQFNIVVSNIGNKITDRFESLLIAKKGEKNYLVHQCIANNMYYLNFYKEDKINFHYEDITMDAVWKKTNILAKYDGTTLFGSNHSLVQQYQSTISCTLYN